MHHPRARKAFARGDDRMTVVWKILLVIGLGIAVLILNVRLYQHRLEPPGADRDAKLLDIRLPNPGKQHLLEYRGTESDRGIEMLFPISLSDSVPLYAFFRLVTGIRRTRSQRRNRRRCRKTCLPSRNLAFSADKRVF
jgi:hypothetical protein